MKLGDKSNYDWFQTIMPQFYLFTFFHIHALLFCRFEYSVTEKKSVSDMCGWLESYSWYQKSRQVYPQKPDPLQEFKEK